MGPHFLKHFLFGVGMSIFIDLQDLCIISDKAVRDNLLDFFSIPQLQGCCTSADLGQSYSGCNSCQCLWCERIQQYPSK